MQFYINQSIHIHSIKISSISNSSILQIGSAGIIKSLSTLANSGEYTEPAPPVPGHTIVEKK
ncbi:spore germination protein GerPB [Bacillus massiliigorillae]|uniref:spore germination protein GerPB n=1 Tax=Bacillus massiliigorillae TaxID=1243664 RepID=UPI0005A769BB|nr:spore germination protein GerPB [Bacillus massiliigorillae]